MDLSRVEPKGAGDAAATDGAPSPELPELLARLRALTSDVARVAATPAGAGAAHLDEVVHLLHLARVLLSEGGDEEDLALAPPRAPRG